MPTKVNTDSKTTGDYVDSLVFGESTSYTGSFNSYYISTPRTTTPVFATGGLTNSYSARITIEQTYEEHLSTHGIKTPIDAISAWFFKRVHYDHFTEKVSSRFNFDEHNCSVLYYLFENEEKFKTQYKNVSHIVIETAYKKNTLHILFADLLPECERIYELSKKYSINEPT
jgi:hypothetical protein